jgi:hypothetical protein
MLMTLLAERDEYRRQWLRFEKREPQAGVVNQAAVAQVIAHYLWDSGDRSESDLRLARTLKDRIRRALTGEVLSTETLGWFVEAFGMSEADARDLRDRRFTGRNISGTLARSPYLPLRQRHRTVAVFERRTIDELGRIIEHRTTRMITAREDGVTSYPYRLVPGARAVDVLHGGRVRAYREFEGSAPIAEIELSRPLRKGEIAPLDYKVLFTVDQEVEPEYRRVAHARVDNLSIAVQFHPSRPPSKVWWTLWDDHRRGNVLREECVSLDRDAGVHRFVAHLENAAAGFRWRW